MEICCCFSGRRDGKEKEQCAKGNLKKLKVARLQDAMFAADSYNFSFSVSDTFFQYTVDRDKKDAALLNCSVFLWRTRQ